MNIFDNFQHNSEIKTRIIRIPERGVMRRKESYTLLDDARSDNELVKMSRVGSAINSSVGGQCRSAMATIEEPEYMVEEELKTDFYFWIRDTEKLLLDRKCKP